VSTTSTLIASGAGWRVSEFVCGAGPRDPRLVERHDWSCVAAVLEGTFQYRSARGATTLAPGALLLGNGGEDYECRHDHGVGDRCLVFHFAPAQLEATAAAVPGVRAAAFPVARVPPLERLAPLIAAAEVARAAPDPDAVEELALRIAAAALALTGPAARPAPAPRVRDERRVSEAVRAIERGAGERDAGEPLSLAALARQAGMSPYHFLRTFRALVGMTPHQYVLRTRLHRVAVRLRRTADPISAIAFEEGFNDLSTFNHRFRRVMGVSPRAFRNRDRLTR
jgi:AraC family transcriptional regulator